MEKKKILFVAEAMGGGVFTYIVDLSNELVRNYNVDIYIAYSIRPQTPENFRDYFDERVHLIEVKNFVRALNPRSDLRAFFELKKIAKAVKPDIIHLHSSKAGAIGRFAFNGRKTPMFYTPHGYSFLMQNYDVKNRTLFKFAENIAAKRCCTTISCSKGEHEETLKITKKATYVNNGINTEELDELLKSVKTAPHPFTVFTLGRICYQKNPVLFNEIALSLPDIQFLWIGDGEMRDTLTADNIRITGWVNRADALRFSVNGDVFVLTSLWEGLPISLLEAMYMKKFCVVSDVIGNKNVIANEKNGFVCDTKSEFINAIKTIRTDRDPSIIDKAYNDIITKFNSRVMAKNYYDIYKERFKN